MIAALALAALSVTVPIDTGWQASTNQLYPFNPPTFSYQVEPAPLGTTSVTACLTIEGRMMVRATNLSTRPIWASGGVSQRTGQSNDHAGSDKWWNPTSGGTWEIPESNPLQPNETRYFIVEWSTGPVCVDLYNVAAWLPNGFPSLTKYGQFDDYRPVVCEFMGEPVSCNDYAIPRRRGLYVATYNVPGTHAYSKGRLHGWMEYQ